MFMTLGQQLLLVSTDRLSAFDWVLPTGIPDKGRVLTQISAFWFERLGGREPPDHDRRAEDAIARTASIAGRWKAARRSAARRGSCRSSAWSAAIFPGSGWAEYQKSRHGLRHPPAGRPHGKRAAAGADLHARPRRPKPATTRTSPSSKWPRPWAAS